MDKIDKAVEVIKQGGIVIFPTDTAFGIGCRMDYEESVHKLFKIRKRPLSKQPPVLFDSRKRVDEYVLPYDKNILRLMDNHWPGALTIVLKCIEEKTINLVRGGERTLGVRIPDHDIPIKLIKEANVPILGMSANFHGGKTPYRTKELDKELIKLVDFCVEGKTKNRIISTVIDCSNSPWKIIRQGDVVL